MSRKLSGQLSPSLPFKSSHSAGVSFFTRNVFTPKQVFKFEGKKNQRFHVGIYGNYYYCYYYFSSSYLPLIGHLIF